MKKLTLWSHLETKKTLQEAQEEFLASFSTIDAWQYPIWYIGYSGGKDSTALVTYLAHAIETKRLPRPEKVVVQYADTGMEIPPLQQSAHAIMETLRNRYSFETQIIRPDLDACWFVYMLGRGVPLPSNAFRYCTRNLKADPMKKNILMIKQEGEKPLLITGIREGESPARDDVITATCNRDNGECGQGYLHVKTSKDTGTDSHAPILGWRVCHVWDWLMWDAPEYGFDTAEIAMIYGQDVTEGEEPLSARTGCMNCPLVTDPKSEHPHPDKMLERVLTIPKYQYLTPLTKLLDIYVTLNQDNHRLRRTIINKKTGESRYPKGPLTLDARRYGLAAVKAVQNEVNRAARVCNMPEIRTPYRFLCNGINGKMLKLGLDWLPVFLLCTFTQHSRWCRDRLINDEEESRILELIAANTWPNGWTGGELQANEFTVPQEEPDTYQLELAYGEVNAC